MSEIITEAQSSSPSLPPYNPSQFANRKHELDIVEKNVQVAQAGGLIKEPIVNFWGVGGIGKTWLLLHLQNLYSYKASVNRQPTFSLYHNFSEDTDAKILSEDLKKKSEEPLSFADLARKLIDEISFQLSPALLSKDQEKLQEIFVSGDIELLVKLLVDVAQRFTPVLLFDNAEQVPQIDWEVFEHFIIEPLVKTGRILIVVAGRRQIPRWRRFEVRRRVMQPQESRMRPFTKEGVREQISLRGYQFPVDLLFPFTAGNPYLVEMFANTSQGWGNGNDIKKLDQSWVDAHRPDILEILHSSSKRLLDNVPTELMAVLKVISPLRSYRLEAVRRMLSIQNDSMITQSEGYFLNLVRKLEQETDVVWWERGLRAYITSEDVRQFLNHVQLLESPKQYSILHNQALMMYWDWVKEYPNVSESSIVEVWFHAASLYRVDHNHESLANEIDQSLNYADKYLNSDRFMILQRQFDIEKPLEADQELLELLPIDIQEALSNKLKVILEAKSS